MRYICWSSPCGGCMISWINSLIMREEDPVSSVALFAIMWNSLPLFLLSFLSPPSSISMLIAFTTSSFFTNTPISSSFPKSKGTSTPILSPIFRTCTINFSFQNWSPKSGHVIMGTPADIPSRDEFQPQCVKNPPIEACDNIRAAEQSADGIVVNTFEELEAEYVKEYTRTKGDKVWCIGPV